MSLYLRTQQQQQQQQHMGLLTTLATMTAAAAAAAGSETASHFLSSKDKNMFGFGVVVVPDIRSPKTEKPDAEI